MPTSSAGEFEGRVGVAMERANSGEPGGNRYWGPVEKFDSWAAAIPASSKKPQREIERRIGKPLLGGGFQGTIMQRAGRRGPEPLDSESLVSGARADRRRKITRPPERGAG